MHWPLDKFGKEVQEIESESRKFQWQCVFIMVNAQISVWWINDSFITPWTACVIAFALQKVKKVVGIELCQEAVEDAKVNARLNGW